MDLEVVKEVGKELKQHRLDKGVSLTDIAKELKIRKSYLKNIEGGEVENMPFEAYLVAYIRNYANFLDLESDNFVQRIKKADIDLKPVGNVDIATNAEFVPSIGLIAFVLLLTIASFLLVVYY